MISKQSESHVKNEFRQRSAGTRRSASHAFETRQFTERKKNQIDFNWIPTALQYTEELVKDMAIVLALVYLPGIGAICVAILFYALSR